ncbi:MAG: general secretion pathway protein GspB [Burkholderiales bacterium]|nr:general secretion pathway protein GspB [Burkholderiales bacterium]
MSYILDALRKSDQQRQRQRGDAPKLLLGQVAAVVPRRPALLYYGLFALFLVGAGMAIGWLRPLQPEPSAPAPAAIDAQRPEPAASPHAAARSDIAPGPEPEANVQKSARDSAPASRAVPVPAAGPVKKKETAGLKSKKRTAASKTDAEAPKDAAATLPRKRESPDSLPAEAAPLRNVMAMADLPLAIQQELPPMSISVHAYSVKAGDRLVGINNRLLHEGQEVAPGLKLEQITQDGMILSFKGYNFRRGVH